MSSDRTTTRLLALAAPLMVKALHYAFAAMVARRRRKLVVDTLKALPGSALYDDGRLADVLGPRDVTGLHVVFDFDRTLTAHDAPQCHDPLLRLEDCLLYTSDAADE